MKNPYPIIAAIVAIVILLLAFRLNSKEHKSKKEGFDLTRFISRVAIFTAISTILYTMPFLKFSIPGFPTFLEVHFDEIPAFLAGFAYGPLSGFMVIFLKTLIKLPISGTATVGEFSDLIFSTMFVVPAALIYKYNRSLKGAIIGLSVGFVSQVITATILNVYLSIPFYVAYYGVSQEILLKAYYGNESIADPVWAYALIAVVPFNLIKNAIVVAITMFVYKPLRRIIEKATKSKIKTT